MAQPPPCSISLLCHGAGDSGPAGVTQRCFAQLCLEDSFPLANVQNLGSSWLVVSILSSCFVFSMAAPPRVILEAVATPATSGSIRRWSHDHFSLPNTLHPLTQDQACSLTITRQTRKPPGKTHSNWADLKSLEFSSPPLAVYSLTGCSKRETGTSGQPCSQRRAEPLPMGSPAVTRKDLVKGESLPSFSHR